MDKSIVIQLSPERFEVVRVEILGQDNLSESIDGVEN